MKLQGEFWKELQGFIMDRTERGLDRFESRREYQRRLNAVEELGRKLYDPNDKAQWEIWDDLFSERATAEGMAMESSYLQGLCDGFALAELVHGDGERLVV